MPKQKTNKTKAARRPAAKPRQAKTLLVRTRKRTKTKSTNPFFRPGRKKGSKDKVPKHFVRTMKAMCEEVIQENVKDIKQAYVDGINSGPQFAHHYLKDLGNRAEGMPQQGMNLHATFKEDELSAAGRELERKMAALFKHVTPLPDATTEDSDVSADT